MGRHRDNAHCSRGFSAGIDGLPWNHGWRGGRHRRDSPFLDYFVKGRPVGEELDRTGQAKARLNTAQTVRCAFIASSTAGTMPKKP